MATPTPKSPEIKALLDSLGNRTKSITSDTCVPAPIGCGGPATEFTDGLSLKEYTISGLCQVCQDNFFHKED